MTSKKNIEDIIFDNVCLLNKKIIFQKDFDNYVITNHSPYIIDSPGYYILGENIETNFFPMINDSLQLNENNPNTFGHPAAFIIASNYVIFDLNEFAIYQSPQDYCVQRFFALIQLNLLPFNIGVGPITSETRTKQYTAEYCIIRNGVLGLSAHQSILGNNNKNIIIEKVNCEDFEVSGITINNGENIFLENSVIGKSVGSFKGRKLGLSPTFSGLTFSHKLLSSVIKDCNTSQNKRNMALNIQNDIEKYLLPFFEIIYCNTTLTNIFSELKSYSENNPDYSILFNKSGKSPCNMHGVKITGPNPSIGAFHTELEESILGHSKNININNVHIENIEGCVDEEIICISNGNVVHICAGLKVSYNIIQNKIILNLINTIYELVKDDFALNKIIKSSINKDSIDFINHGLNITNNCGFIRGMDIMAHINKGIHGLRIGSSNNVNITNCKIKHISNIGNIVNDRTIEEIKIKFQGVEEISSPDTTLLTNNHFIGSSSIGVIFSGCHYVKVDSIDISNINALNGVAFGNVVNNKCNYVNLFNLNIYNLLSKSCCIESSALTIDHLAKNIQINNTNVH